MKHIIYMQYERAFNFLLQHVDCDTEQRSGNLTFPKDAQWCCHIYLKYKINSVINGWVSINIKINFMNCGGSNNVRGILQLSEWVESPPVRIELVP